LQQHFSKRSIKCGVGYDSLPHPYTTWKMLQSLLVAFHNKRELENIRYQIAIKELMRVWFAR